MSGVVLGSFVSVCVFAFVFPGSHSFLGSIPRCNDARDFFVVSRGTFEVVMAEKGWTTDDFALAAELKPAEQAAALCDNQVDAIVFTVGHPSGTIQVEAERGNVFLGLLDFAHIPPRFDDVAVDF